MSNNLKYRLKELRLEQKKSARYMATKCQVTEVTYRIWELLTIDDARSIPVDPLRLLCKDLGVLVDEIFAYPAEA